ncbi:MAG TPA: glycosyltransferase family 2 protein [Oligoflexia bacterium]|nr:glycosyltransferase family 2 protein [Oligoflexia bacterium]
MPHNLWIVMPVYNEEASLASVILEWIGTLDDLGVGYTFLAINDGSTDSSLQILNDHAFKNSSFKVIDKANTGHGQSCIFGYRYAIENGADWILQIDSDGQCDPYFLPEFVSASQNYSCIYGYRKTRDDGFFRALISSFVSVFTFAATFIWIRDANVPYRLIRADLLSQIVKLVPEDFHLANILVSVLCKKLSPIHWVPIHFRKRTGGTASIKTFSFVRHGFKLFRQLRNADINYSQS